MSKYLYSIMHLPIQRYLKWWLDKQAEGKEQVFIGISETNPAYLTDCLKRAFLKFIIKGKTEQGENPSPVNPQEIVNVEGNINVSIKGKNLCSNIFSDYTMNNGSYGYIKLIESFSKPYLTATITDNNPDIDMTGIFFGFTMTGGTFETGSKWILSNGIESFGRVVTTSECKYFSFYPKNQETFNKIFSRYNIQIEQGSESSYEEYQGKTYNFPLSAGQKLMEGDYLADDGIHHVKGQVVLNGTENWYEYTTSPEGCYRVYTNSVMIGLTPTLSYDTIKSNYFQSKPYLEKNSINATQYATYINIDNTIANTIADFKTWLSNHNTIVEYELKEETIESYTQEQQAVYDEIINAGTYKGITNISVTANINPDLYIEYQKSKEDE